MRHHQHHHRHTEQIRKVAEFGFSHAEALVHESERAHVPLSLALALCEQESTRAWNVFGHDEVRNPVKGGTVTHDRYREYLRYRHEGLGCQGVGPCQLTYGPTQDYADKLGGCWRPEINMRVGFGTLAGNIRRDGLYAGVEAYNGTGPAAQEYARSVLSMARRWHRSLNH